MKNTKSVFVLNKEYTATQFFNTELNYGGVEISLNDERLGCIVGLDIPEIDNLDANIKFDNEVENWIVDNEF